MILRFRDDKIRRLEEAVAGRLPIDDYLVEENKRLGEELELVRAQIDRNPELTRFAMDNIRLQEQVRGYALALALILTVTIYTRILSQVHTYSNLGRWVLLLIPVLLWTVFKSFMNEGSVR